MSMSWIGCWIGLDWIGGVGVMFVAGNSFPRDGSKVPSSQAKRLLKASFSLAVGKL